MTNTVNHSFDSSELDEDDDATAHLIDVLRNVINECSFNDLDFDLLLSAAARSRVTQFMAEQAEERSLS